jgi:hypothetical protein
MRGRLLFVAGLAAGYVVGARAGRPAYDAIAERLHGVADSPTVHDATQRAKGVLEDKAPKVAAVAEQVAATTAGAAEAASKASGDKSDAGGSEPAASGSTTEASSPSTAS